MQGGTQDGRGASAGLQPPQIEIKTTQIL